MIQKHHVLVVGLLAMFGVIGFSGGILANPSKSSAASNYSVNITTSSITSFGLSIGGTASASPYVGSQGSQGVYITSWGDGTPASAEATASSFTFGGGNFTATWSASHTYPGAGTYTAVAAVCHQGCTGAEGANTSSVTVTVLSDGSGSVTGPTSGGGGGGGGAQLNPEKAITSFGYQNAGGVITGTNISLLVPFGTDITKLAPTFTFVGESVKVGSVVQTSDTTENDFTSPVTYTVTATNQSTMNYLVTVTVLPDPNAPVATPDVPQAKSAPCLPILTAYIKLGAQNNSGQVKALQNFLNSHEGTTLIVDGIYKQADFAAVEAFQAKYNEVLHDWGIAKPTGYVFKSTVRVVNRLACESSIQN